MKVWSLLGADKYRYYGVCCHKGWILNTLGHRDLWGHVPSSGQDPSGIPTSRGSTPAGALSKTVLTQKWDNSNTVWGTEIRSVQMYTLFTFFLSVLLWFVCWVISLHTYLVRLAFLCIAFVVLSYIYTSLVREGLQIMMIIISSVYCESKCISIQDRDTWNQWLLQ